MFNIFPLALPTYALPSAAAITAIFVVTTIVMAVFDPQSWRFQARLASYCSLGVLSASIATENAPWALAALAFYLLWPRPAVTDAR